MSSRTAPDRHRPPRRPRFEPDDYSDSDSGDYYDDRRPARPSRRERPPPPVVDLGPAPRRGPPVPIDEPDYPPQERPRARSKVRLKEPSISSDSDTSYRREKRRPRGARTDLERKDSPEHAMFRSKRDGYLSDEGAAHKTSRRTPRARRERDDSDSEVPSSRRRDRLDPAMAGAAGAAGGLALPHRGNTRAKSMEPPPPYPSEDAYGPPPRGHRRSDYDTDPDGPSRRRSTREPRADPRREPRREARPRYDDYYDESPPPRRRDDGGRARGGYPDDRDRGYRSDHGGRSRRDDDYRRSDRDAYDRRSRGGDGYRSDHGPSRRDAYDDPRDGGRRSGQPRRDYGDDRRDRDRHRSSRGGGSSSKKKGALGGFHIDEDWQKGATTMFLQYGLPILKKEGPKWAKQAQGYWAKRGGGF